MRSDNFPLGVICAPFERLKCNHEGKRGRGGGKEEKCVCVFFSFPTRSSILSKEPMILSIHSRLFSSAMLTKGSEMPPPSFKTPLTNPMEVQIVLQARWTCYQNFDST